MIVRYDFPDLAEDLLSAMRINFISTKFKESRRVAVVWNEPAVNYEDTSKYRKGYETKVLRTFEKLCKEYDLDMFLDMKWTVTNELQIEPRVVGH